MVSLSSTGRWLPLGLGVLLLATAASAQQSTFSHEITVTATGVEQAADEVPVPVTVIGREEIEDAQQGSVAEMLRRAPGLLIVRAGGEGAATSLFTRGTESDHTLAMFDGVRLNSPYFGGYDWSLLPTAGLERIEVARGPFSALWGADAVGGVVNVVPVRGRGGPSASLVGESGGDGWRRLEGALGWSAGGFDAYLSAFDAEGEGEQDNSDFSTRQLLLDAGWSWSDGNRVAVLVQELATELGIPYADPVTQTPNRRQSSDQRLLAVPVRLRLGEDWRLEVVASRVSRELDFRDPDDPFGFTEASTEADTVQVRAVSHHGFSRHALSWGAEWRQDEVTDSSSFGVNLAGRATQVGSVFVQDVWRPLDALRVIAGVRWDDADEWGGEFSPRIALGWELGSGVELRAAYGRAFRQPSVGELYFPFSGTPDLDPERSRTAEAGVVWLAGLSRLELSLFRTRIEDLIEFDFAEYAFSNVAEATMRGVEASWEAPLSSGLASTVQATWLQTEDAVGEPLLRRPRWSGGWTLHGRVGDRWRGDLTLLWVGARADVDPVTFERVELDGHLTGTLAVALELVDGLEATLRIRNLADERYEEVAGYPAPGRRISGGLRWRL